MEGLLGGLTQMGLGMAQAGQSRPMGQAGPGLGDAFASFGTGQRAGLLNAYQNAEMEKKQKRTALLAEAQSSKPDTDISPAARTMRAALAGVSPEVRALADPSELPGVVLRQAEAAGQRMMPQWQPSTLLDPATEAQRLRIARGSQQPQTTWRDERDTAGNVTGQRSSLGQFQPTARADGFTLGEGQSRFGPGGNVVATGGPKLEPVNPGNARNTIARLSPQVEAGTLDPASKDGRDYLAAQDALLTPMPFTVTMADGSQRTDYNTPPFSFPKLDRPPGTTTDARAGATKPPPALTESQATSANYMNRMVEAEKRMESALGGGYKPGGVRDAMAGSVPVFGNFLMSDKGQNYKQAQEDWVRAKLRKESGAVIAESEMAAEIRTYFPKPGDSPEVIQQKAEARATAVQSLGIGAGRAGQNLPGGATPAARATPADPLGILK